MLIKCKDQKLVNFDDNVMPFSKTISNIKKYTNNNVLSLHFCESKLISIINEWLVNRFFRFQDIEVLHQVKSQFYDKHFFSSLQTKNIEKDIIICLLKAADYLEIDFLIHALTLFISVRLTNFTADSINKYFITKKIPKNIKEKIFFLICYRRFILGGDYGNQNLLHNAFFKESVYNDFFSYKFSNFFFKGL